MCLFFNSEKEDDDNEKREDPGDNWEEGGGGSGAEKSSGPWNKTALVQAPPAPVTGDLLFSLLRRGWAKWIPVYVSLVEGM